MRRRDSWLGAPLLEKTVTDSRLGAPLLEKTVTLLSYFLSMYMLYSVFIFLFYFLFRVHALFPVEFLTFVGFCPINFQIWFSAEIKVKLNVTLGFTV